jgi:hypothetical protein
MATLICLMMVYAPGVDLQPASFEDVLAEYGPLIAEGETPLAGLGGMDDSTAVVLAGEFQPQGPVFFVLFDVDQPGLPGCVLYRDSLGEAGRVDFDASGPYQWWLWEIRGVHADDFDGDGWTDLMVVADFMTGIGHEGAVPFMVHTVLLWDPVTQEYVYTEDLTH